MKIKFIALHLGLLGLSATLLISVAEAKSARKLYRNFIGSEEYVKLPATAKSAHLLGATQETLYRNRVLYDAQMLALLPAATPSLVCTNSLEQVFTGASDIRRSGLPKPIHPQGLCAQADLEVKNPVGTGLFGLTPRSKVALFLRASLAAPPAPYVAHLTQIASHLPFLGALEKMGYTPGLAVKFLLDGRPSTNLLLMHDLGGQGVGGNFFAEEFYTSFPVPQVGWNPFLRPMFSAFQKTVERLNPKGSPVTLPLDELASVLPNGTNVAGDLSIPKKMILVHNRRLQTNPRFAEGVDLRDSLPTIKPGTVLSAVYVENANGDREHYADIVLTSKFMASTFCDYDLNFQHFMNAPK